MSRFWSCDLARCSKAAAIDVGICRRCSGHFCSDHFASPEHTCEADLDDDAWEAALFNELKSLRQRINLTKLLNFASQINAGLPCSLDDSDDLSTCLLGGMHIHLRIKFVTGKSWLARVPRMNEASFPDDLTNRILLNECATLKWLECIDIPSPQLHGYALLGEARNNVGVAFMLVDEMPGKPFNRDLATEKQLLQVYSQWASFLSKLSQHPFDKIGSLMIADSGTIEIGAVTGDRTGTLDRLGPFDSGRDFYIGLANEYLRLIADKQVLGRFSVDAYLLMKYIRSLLESAKYSPSPVLSAFDRGPFYLKHTDDKGDHLLVDEHWNISGVIDWSFARFVPAYEAFGPSLLTADMDDIYSGVTGRTRHDALLGQCLEMEGGVVAKFAQAGDHIRRFQFGIGIGSDLTWTEAFSLFKGILMTVSKVDILLPWNQWRQDLINEWLEEDATLKALIEQEGFATTISEPGIGQ